MVEYKKKFKDYTELADLAISRGLEVPSKEALVDVFESISYFRFSGYLFPFKQNKSDNFLSNTTLDKVMSRYSFDKKLREITFKAFTEVEVQLRNDISHEHKPAPCRHLK